MAAIALLKMQYPLKNGCPQLFCEIKKQCFLKKKLFHAIKHSNLQRKNVF